MVNINPEVYESKEESQTERSETERSLTSLPGTSIVERWEKAGTRKHQWKKKRESWGQHHRKNSPLDCAHQEGGNQGCFMSVSPEQAEYLSTVGAQCLRN